MFTLGANAHFMLEPALANQPLPLRERGLGEEADAHRDRGLVGPHRLRTDRRLRRAEGLDAGGSCLRRGEGANKSDAEI